MADNHWKIHYMAAIRALPEKWIHPDSKVAAMTEDMLIAANPGFLPIKFVDGRWEEIKFDRAADYGSVL